MRKPAVLVRSNFAQKGATLVVVMVVLVVMTFLGLGAMSDANIQLAMVRNNQLQTVAHIAAQTELEAQLSEINGNDGTIADPIILDMLDVGLAGGISRTLNIGDGSGEFEVRLDDVVGASEYGKLYSSSVILVEPDATNIKIVAGNSIDPDFPIKLLQMQFQSSVTINNTRTTSTQVQGFEYAAAN